jgi:hypothetical protein
LSSEFKEFVFGIEDNCIYFRKRSELGTCQRSAYRQQKCLRCDLKQSVFTKLSRQVGINVELACELITEHLTGLNDVFATSNPAIILTKSLPTTKFTDHRLQIG